jgi:hypothetical protein
VHLERERDEDFVQEGTVLLLLGPHCHAAPQPLAEREVLIASLPSVRFRIRFRFEV